MDLTSRQNEIFFSGNPQNCNFMGEGKNISFLGTVFCPIVNILLCLILCTNIQHPQKYSTTNIKLCALYGICHCLYCYSVVYVHRIMIPVYHKYGVHS